PGSAAAAEALYAIGRIHQEAERYGAAHAAYVELAARYPRAPLAAEARWRAGWVRYLAGDFVGAASWFERLAARSARGPRVAAEYWHARTLERLGREAEARARLVHVADRHPTSYYAAVAEARLGRPASAPAVPPARGWPPMTGPPAPWGGWGGRRGRGPGSCTSPIGIRRRTPRRSPGPVSGARHPRGGCPPPVRRPSPPMWAGRTASAPACSS